VQPVDLGGDQVEAGQGGAAEVDRRGRGQERAQPVITPAEGVPPGQRDVGAVAAAAGEDALAAQFVEGGADRGAADVQGAGQDALGRQPGAGRQQPGPDQAAQPVGELRVQGTVPGHPAFEQPGQLVTADDRDHRS